MMKPHIRAVCIDFDDTLCMTEEACFYLENAVLAQMGRSAMTHELHIQTWGQQVYEAIKTRSPGIDVDRFRELLEPTHQKFVLEGRIDVVPAANLEALLSLKSLGKTISVLTSRTEPELSHILKDNDHVLHEVVERFYHADNVPYIKPDPRVFGDLLRETGFSPSEIVYIGDSPNDARAAKGAGLHFIASLESGIRPKDEFEGLGVDAFVRSFPEVVVAVQALSNNSK